jgi:hypothetical protein
LILIQKRDGAWRGIQINRINQYDCVGLLIDDQAQVVLWNILGVDDTHPVYTSDLSGHKASGCVVAAARIANAHDYHLALNPIGKLFL